jgi:hypothetical protein
MGEVRPLYEDSRLVRYRGRFNVLMEIPSDSTLSEGDIRDILSLSSWESDPNGRFSRREGNRSVLIGREYPAGNNGLQTTGLQVSGTGYFAKRMEFMDRTAAAIRNDEALKPPEKGNFMDTIPKNIGSTTKMRGKREVGTRREYAPIGSYSESEMREKVEGTRTAFNLGLEKFIVPRVEAFGWYTDPEMMCNHNRERMAFMVTQVPDDGSGRFAEEFLARLADYMQERDPNLPQLMMYYWSNMSPVLAALGDGFRELHDLGYVHLQPHFSNIYFIREKTYTMHNVREKAPVDMSMETTVTKGRIFLVDWATMERMGSGRRNIIGNRTIDLGRSIQQYIDLMPIKDGEIGQMFRDGSDHAVEAMLEVYSLEPMKEIVLKRLAEKYMMMGKRMKNQSDFIRAWLDEHFDELTNPTLGTSIVGEPLDDGFAPSLGKPSRNSPCACGSGKKFKRCCGKC